MAKLLDIEPRRVQQLARQGIIKKNGRGKYDLLLCAREYIRYLHGQSGEKRDAHAEKTRLLAAQADKQEMENAVRRGELLPADQVSHGIVAVVSNLKARIRAIPVKVAPLAATMSRAAEVADIIAEEIDQALTEIARVEIQGVVVNTDDADGS